MRYRNPHDLTVRSHRDARDALADIPRQLAELRTLDNTTLKQRYCELFGHPPRSHNPDFLRKRLSWKIQEIAKGGLTDRARAKIEELAPAPIRKPTRADRAAATATPAMPPEPVATAKSRDPRLPPPGTVLRREYQGKVYEVTVLEQGFDYAGRHYRTLSRLATDITGTHWNGMLFWGLTSRKKGTEGTR